MICRHTTSFDIWITKNQDLGNFELSPMQIRPVQTLNFILTLWCYSWSRFWKQIEQTTKTFNFSQGTKVPCFAEPKYWELFRNAQSQRFFYITVKNATIVQRGIYSYVWGPLSLCPQGIFSCFFVVCYYFQNQISNRYFRNTIKVSNSLDPGQARFLSGLVWVQIVCKMLSADGIWKQRVKHFTCLSLLTYAKQALVNTSN